MSGDVTEFAGPTLGDTTTVNLETETIEWDTTQVVSVGVTGPRGLQGLAGIDGGAASPYHFEQADPLSVWTIHHNRNAYPTAVLRDIDGALMIARYDWQDANTVVVSLASPRAGTAELIF